MIAVNNNEPVEPKALCYMTTQTNMIVQLMINWYASASGGTPLATTTDNFTLTASEWQWALGTSHAPASGAQFYTVTVQQESCAANNPLQVAMCGAVYTTAIGLVQVGMLINDSGVSTTTPVATGWTHDYGTTAETPLCMDVFHSTGSGVGGDICAGTYGSSVPWAGLTISLSTMAGFAEMAFDDQTLYAMGGCSVPLSVATGGVGGSGGTDNALPPPYQNDGGNGANGASPDGGGGGSGGGYGTGAWTDDNASEFVYSSHTAPLFCMSPLPVRRSGSWEGAVLYGGDIYQYGADGHFDTILVLVITNSSATPAVGVTDTQDNTYQFMKTNTLPDGTKAQTFYCSGANNGGSYTPLVAGVDAINLTHTSAPGDYLVLAYVWRCSQAIDSHSSGEVQTSFTGASGSVSSGTTDNSFGGHFVISFADDGNQTTGLLPLVAVDNENVGTNFGTLFANPGFNTNLVVDTWWQNDISSGGDTFNFTRPASATVDVDVINLHAYVPVGWQYATGAAQYYDGTHHYANEGGNEAVITFSGPRCLLMGKLGPDQGQAWVQLDGGAWTTIDNYSPNPQYQQVIYDTGAVPNTTHTITVLTLGRGNASSTNTFIDLDGYQTVTGGAGLNGVTLTGGAANAPYAGAGGNGGANAAGSNGGLGSGGGGASSTSGTKTGGSGGAAEIVLTYFSSLPQFKTAILHRPSLDGSTTLNPYIACASQAVPTNDQVQSLDSGTLAHFQGTYSMMVAAASWNNPSAQRTITVTVNEYERLGGSITATQSITLAFTPNSPPPGMGNGIITVGELTLPMKAIPPDNDQAVYFVSVNSGNPLDTIQDVMMIDTQGQTVYINETTGLTYAQYFVDEPTPDADIGLTLGSQYDRSYAISVLDQAYPSGGPLTVEPGDNVLFAYCYEGAPALIANYFPRYYIDRPTS
jgi:hypothetical protein